ncbi:MAG: C25 family cysteine peptidase, partial [Fidelibacterota bacterium]
MTSKSQITIPKKVQDLLGGLDEGDYILLEAKPNVKTYGNIYYDPFSSENFYWIYWGGESGKRLIEESARVSSINLSFPHSFFSDVRVERDGYFARLGGLHTNRPSYEIDHWFWDGGVNKGELKEYQFQLSFPDTGRGDSSSVMISLRSLVNQNPSQHQLFIYLNGRFLSTAKWFGGVEKVVKVKVSSSILRNGGNRLTLFLPGNYSSELPDIVTLNWIKLHYKRLFVVKDGGINFKIPGVNDIPWNSLVIKGFSSPGITVIRKGISKLEDFEVRYEEDSHTYSLILPYKSAHIMSEFVAVEESKIIRNPPISVDKKSNLKFPLQGYDYLIISHKKFIDELSPLAMLRGERGYKVRLIDVQDIYDEFNYGLKSPYALKSFLKYAYDKWPEPRIRFVLLVGDASFESRRAVENGGQDFLPTFFVQTEKWGAAASDFWYSLLDSSDFEPEIAIGRIPCKTKEEARWAVRKILNYERRPPQGLWKRRILLIAGNGEVFRLQSKQLALNYIPYDFEVNYLFTGVDYGDNEPRGNRDDLIEYFSDGLLAVNFLGHGGGAVWSDNSLLDIEGVDLLENKDKLPFIASFTCFTGAFDSPDRLSLGEKLLTSKNGGAVAFLGSSSLGWVHNDYEFAKHLLPMLSERDLTLGEMINAAKLEYFRSSSDMGYIKPSILFQYNLLGDPALSLAGPEDITAVKLSPTDPSPGETIAVSGDVNFNGGAGVIRIFNDRREAILSSPAEFSFSGYSFKAALEVPRTAADGRYLLHLYITGKKGDIDASGYTFFSVNRTYFSAFQTVPENPTHRDSIRFKIDLFDRDGISSATCFSGLNYERSFEMRSSDGDTYITRGALGPLEPGAVVKAFFAVEDSGGNLSISDTFKVKIEGLPDFSISSLKMGGVKRAGVVVSVFSTTTVDTSIEVGVYRLRHGGENILMGEVNFL